MIPNLSEGDTVDITIRGARVYGLPDPEDDPGERWWGFDLADRYSTKPARFSVPLDFPQVTVTHGAPENWPPQAGDVWSDECPDGAEEWHALPIRACFPEVRLHLDSALAGLDPAAFRDSYPKARLVRRREVTS